jgi:hypothetical protein
MQTLPNHDGWTKIQLHSCAPGVVRTGALPLAHPRLETKGRGYACVCEVVGSGAVRNPNNTTTSLAATCAYVVTCVRAAMLVLHATHPILCACGHPPTGVACSFCHPMQQMWSAKTTIPQGELGGRWLQHLQSMHALARVSVTKTRAFQSSGQKEGHSDQKMQHNCE